MQGSSPEEKIGVYSRLIDILEYKNAGKESFSNYISTNNETQNHSDV